MTIKKTTRKETKTSARIRRELASVRKSLGAVSLSFLATNAGADLLAITVEDETSGFIVFSCCASRDDALLQLAGWLADSAYQWVIRYVLPAPLGK